MPSGLSVAAFQDPVDVGERVLAALGVEQMGPREVAQPVAQRHEAPQRADVRGGECDLRVRRAQHGGREIEHEVVRADRDYRAIDLADATQQLDLDGLPRVVPLEARRDDQQAVGTH